MVVIRNLCATLLLVLLPSVLHAQTHQAKPDTVKISLQQAEQLFLKNNFQLLASRYMIEAAKAGKIQAQLWNNPTLSVGQNIYNWDTKRYFDFTKEGNTDISLQQLFVLAGKRDKQIRLADINTQISENTFYDLLRALKYELRGDFYNLYFLQQSLTFYDESISSLQKTSVMVDAMYEKRSILLSEELRIKSLMLSLESSRLGVINQINQIQSDLHILLSDTTHSTAYYLPQLDTKAVDNIKPDTLSLPNIIVKAIENRPDLKSSLANIKYEETNLSLQKALAVPDVTVGLEYTRNGSYIPEYWGLTVSVDLPVFNRNQGNIRVSENTLEANKYAATNAKLMVEKDVTTAFQNASQIDKLYRTLDKKIAPQYQQLVQGMIANYQKRNMSLIEFTDFYESYRSSILQLYQLQNDRLNAFEFLNFSVGTSIINPY